MIQGWSDREQGRAHIGRDLTASLRDGPGALRIQLLQQRSALVLGQALRDERGRAPPKGLLEGHRQPVTLEDSVLELMDCRIKSPRHKGVLGVVLIGAGGALIACVGQLRLGRVGPCGRCAALPLPRCRALGVLVHSCYKGRGTH